MNDLFRKMEMCEYFVKERERVKEKGGDVLADVLRGGQLLCA